MGTTTALAPSGWTGPPGIAGIERARPRRTRTGGHPQPRALTEVERKQIKTTLESDEFVDEAPATVYAKLLDQGTYLASVSTMYRVLHEHDEVRERRRQATHPAHKKPELIATGAQRCGRGTSPNCTDPEKWTYYYLYVILDIYSRYAVGWMLARAERAELSKRLIERDDRQAGRRQGSTHDSLRSRLTHDRQGSGAPLGRPRGDQVAQPAAREQ